MATKVTTVMLVASFRPPPTNDTTPCHNVETARRTPPHEPPPPSNSAPAASNHLLASVATLSTHHSASMPTAQQARSQAHSPPQPATIESRLKLHAKLPSSNMTTFHTMSTPSRTSAHSPLCNPNSSQTVPRLTPTRSLPKPAVIVAHLKHFRSPPIRPAGSCTILTRNSEPPGRFRALQAIGAAIQPPARLEMGKSGSVRFFTLFAQTSNPRFGSKSKISEPEPQGSVQFGQFRRFGPVFFWFEPGFWTPRTQGSVQNHHNPNLNPEPGFSSVRFGFKRNLPISMLVTEAARPYGCSPPLCRSLEVAHSITSTTPSYTDTHNGAVPRGGGLLEQSAWALEEVSEQDLEDPMGILCFSLDCASLYNTMIV
ncbi:hypothetical protein C8F01DRAFT_1083755 [Mycena amicta]|nr:hypothetical protein C8F01DRAFT_1083755 [Mycena amicta]